MFKFNDNDIYNEFDGIVLTFDKGRNSWANYKSSKTFRALGDFDYFSVTPVNLKEETNVSSQFISAYSNLIENKNDSKFAGIHANDSSQHLFGIAKCSGSDGFWHDEEYPYTFVSLVQFGEGFTNFNDSENEIEEYFEEKKRNLCIDYKIYRSFDVSDLFVFIKAKKFEEGKSCIHKMKCEIKADFYSYSRTGLITEKLKESEDKINKLVLCAVVDNPIKFVKWRKALGEKYPDVREFDRLGHEDYCANIYDMTVGELVTEMESGLFQNSLFEGNSGYNGAVLRPRIILDSESNLTRIVDRSTEHKNPTTLLEQYKDYDRDKNIKKYMLPCMKIALDEIFTSISLLEETFFARDVVACVRHSFERLIADIYQTNKNIKDTISEEPEDGDKAVYKLQLHEELQKYVNSIMSVIQGTLRADKTFFQVPGFNTSLYDVPSKLLVFYIAFMNKVVYLLNDSGNCDFRFIFNLGLHPKIVVHKLFDMNKHTLEADRLLEIKIPVMSLFMPHRLMHELIHEAAHIVGVGYRCRDKRFNAIKSVLIEIIGIKLLFISEDVEKVYENLFSDENIYEECITFISQYLDVHISDGICQDTEFISLDEVKQYLYKAAASFLSYFEFEKFITEFVQKIQKINANASIEYLNYIIHIIYKNGMLIGDECRKLINNICDLMSESFADFVMLKIVDNLPETYLKSFYELNKSLFGRRNKENLLTGYTVERIFSVFKSQFNIDVIEFIDSRAYNSVWLKIFKGQLNGAIREREQIHDTLTFWTEKYLNECNEKWDEIFLDSKDTEKKLKLDNVRKIFTNAVNSETLETFWYNFREEYEHFINLKNN